MIVLHGGDLRARGITTVADALRDVPGASLAQSGSFGGVTSLFLRGGESRYTKILIDGTPINSVGGNIALENLTLDNVDRIEVVEGPSSALFGADAMAGVIQIFTRTGSRPAAVDITAEIGSYDSHNTSAAFRGRTGLVGYSVGAAWRDTRGVAAFNNRYSDGTLSAALSITPDASSSIHVTTRYTGSVYHFPTDYTGAPVDSNSYSRQHRLVAGLDASRALLPELRLRFMAGDNEVHDLSEDTQRVNSPGADSLAKTSAPSDGYRRFGELRAELRTSDAALVTVGAQYQLEAERTRLLTRTYTTEPSSVPVQSAPGSNDSRTTRGYYIAAQGAVRALAYDASARYDTHSDYHAVTTYHAGTSLRMWHGARLRVAYGTGFNAPAFYETQGSAYNRPNPSLQPEQVHAIDVGITQALFAGRVTGSVGAFDQRFTQQIQYVPAITTGPPAYTPIAPAYYDNLTQTRSKGYEGSVAANLPNHFAATASYTQVIPRVYSVAPTFTGSLRAGDALLRRPSHTGSAALSYVIPHRWSAATTVTYVGRRPDVDFSQFPSPTVTLPAYSTVDVAASADMFHVGSSAVALTARAENLFDRRYEPVLHFPAPGRSVFVGMRLSTLP